jgi:hypothetical protein
VRIDHREGPGREVMPDGSFCPKVIARAHRAPSASAAGEKTFINLCYANLKTRLRVKLGPSPLRNVTFGS